MLGGYKRLQRQRRGDTNVNLPCHVILVKPGCGVTVYLTVAVRALELFPASEKAALSRFKLVKHRETL